MDVHPWRVHHWLSPSSETSSELRDGGSWISLHEQDKTSHGHDHARRSTDGIVEWFPFVLFFCRNHRQRCVFVKGAQNFIVHWEHFNKTLGLTADLQHCVWHQVAIFVPDFIYAAVPSGQTHNDNFLLGTIHPKRNEALVAQVTVCYLALADQLHRTIIGPGVRLVKGGRLRVLSGDENKVAVRNRKGQAHGLLE